MAVDAVIFDLDGVLVDSERAWDAARRAVVAESGGRWRPGATEAMQGMSSPEWSAYLHDELGASLPAPEINARVVERVEEQYRRALPLLPGAVDAVERLAARWPLGLASSSNREIIDLVLERAGLGERFAVSVSSEEVARGKPAPDVYRVAAERLGVAPARCAAIEDSTNGLRSARAAGMRVIAVPNHDYPPAPDALALADAVVGALDELSVELVAGRST